MWQVPQSPGTWSFVVTISFLLTSVLYRIKSVFVLVLESVSLFT